MKAIPWTRSAAGVVCAISASIVFACGGGQSASNQDVTLGDGVTDSGGKDLQWPDLLDGWGEADKYPGDWNPFFDLNLDTEIDLPGPEEGEFGWPCLEGSECLSGYCVTTDDGSVCTRICDEDCPDGWLCKAALNSYPDVVYICVPEVHRLCETCQGSTDCAAQGDLCLEIGEGQGIGKFCLQDCSLTECPADYTCTDILDESGQTLLARQCVPNTGSCICKPGIQGNTRPCSIENGFGTCFGLETCSGPEGWTDCTALTPSAETCDSQDNDCDGSFDEGFSMVNWQGSTKVVGEECGTGLCSGGTVICTSLESAGCSTASQATAETCNGFDDDCDGQTDEGVLIPFYADEDGDQHGDAAVFVMACTAPQGMVASSDDCDDTNNLVGPGFTELCDGIDNDCDLVVDQGWTWQAPGGVVYDLGQPCGEGLCFGGAVVCSGLASTECTALLDAVDESCDNLDNDCDGETDNGCDDDGDGFCDATLEYVESSLCPNGSEDCNDTVDHIYPGAPEHCDGIDEDCNEVVDNDFVDCEAYSCTGSFDDYFETAEADCIDGDCISPDAVGCGLYTCQGGGSLGEHCAVSCESDAFCIPSAHCEEGPWSCVLDYPNGHDCIENSDCASNHCQNGFCCLSGDCCAQPFDCPESYWKEPSCDSPTTCQGSRRDAKCLQSRCQPSDMIQDDSACGTDITALDCSPYLPKSCTGNVSQTPPVCPTTCITDASCIEGYYCDGTCVPKKIDGEACSQAMVCASGHCQNGFCCAAGDCCATATNCSTVLYAQAASCDQPSVCQGTRKDAVCVSSICLLGDPTDDDSACTPSTLALDCGAYVDRFCAGGDPQTPPSCPLSCLSHEECASGFHCEGTCLANYPNGSGCVEDAQCLSSHCQNGFCCASGDCCFESVNCPDSYSSPSECSNPTTCQGTRLDKVCDNFRCASSAPVGDDTDCSAEVQARQCTPYQPLFCNGNSNQTAPTCPTSCVLDEDCVDGYHCDGTCKADLVDGGVCDEDSDCNSQHCQNAHCCASGDCCAQPSDCPLTYQSAAVCDATTTCQGTRTDALCSSASICQQSAPIGDDSACGTDLQALTCAPYDPVFCKGTANQTAPVCPTTCTLDSQCIDGYHCDASACTPDLGDGSSCDEGSDCISGHCQNNFCCSSGDCCSQPSDCNSLLYGETASCVVPATCQGTRRDPVCQGNVCGKSGPVEDDSGCSSTTLANDCGSYLGVYCNGTSVQNAPSCPVACTQDGQCDANAHCDSICVPDLPAGDSCDEQTDCQTGLTCVDGVCCTSSCSGLCKRCDIAGHVGTCWNIPSGGDPDSECAGFSCSSYYWGWTGDNCYRRDNISDSEATCGGSGTCAPAADLCPTQGQGTLATTCNVLCQDPNTSTCSGTTAPVCTNVNPGTLSCGTGACYNTVNQCVNGSLNTCTPLPAGIETCNNVDDDCTGTIDDNLGSSTNNFESNATCSVAAAMDDVIEGGSQTITSYIYGSGDQDYYRVKVVEQSGICFPFSSEPYRVTITLTPPSGSDCVNYNLQLYSDACGLISTSSSSSCTAETIIYDYDGTCTLNDDRYLRIRVYGSDSSQWECKSYSLKVQFASR